MTPYRPNIWMYEGDNDSHVKAWRERESSTRRHVAYLMGAMQAETSTFALQRLQQYWQPIHQTRTSWMHMIAQGLANSVKW